MMPLPGNALERRNLDSRSNINGRRVSDFLLQLFINQEINKLLPLVQRTIKRTDDHYSPSSAEMNLSTGCKIGQYPQAQGLSAMSWM